MRRHLYFSPDALRRLDRIHAYSAESWGRPKADNYMRTLYAAMDNLTSMPSLGKPYKKYRILRTGEHYIVYRSEKSAIYIITVLHVAMDISEQLRLVLDRH